MRDLRAPFPWFGGKSKVAHIVWDRFGNVVNYVEPFFGSGAVLLSRPHPPTIETVNDIDCLLVNFWRATQYAPEEVAKHADWPVHETEMHAWHVELVKQKAAVRAGLEADPRWFDAELAGKWVWGLCAWIGSGWCSGKNSRQMPELGGQWGNGKESGAKQGRGVPSPAMRLPALGAGSGGQDDHPCAHYGKGVHSQSMRRPQLSNHHGSGVHGKDQRTRLYEVFEQLRARMKHVRVTCGPAERILTPAVTWRHGTTGIFLDPPYPPDSGCEKDIYSGSVGVEREAFDSAFRYCVENGHDKRLRIALCYYEGTLSDGKNVSEALCSLGWDIVAWKAGGGYGGQSGTNENAARERIAFSPGCLRAKQGSLFT
jgi:DNA adenine methylase